jgi:hypothetical protein
MAAQIRDYETREKREWEGQAAQSENGSERSDYSNGEGVEQKQVATSTPEDDGGSDGNKENDDDADPTPEENDNLMRMGINTALAIGLHNFPEGLASFVATFNDPQVGGQYPGRSVRGHAHLLRHGQPLESLWLGRLVGFLVSWDGLFLPTPFPITCTRFCLDSWRA